MRLMAAIMIAAAIYGVIFLISPVTDRLLLRPWHSWQVRRHKKLLAERLAAGKDRYFEELRSLQTYDPDRQGSLTKKGLFNHLAELFFFAMLSHQIYRMLPENF
jgi:hypothetical protein